ncbi:hypothetical protein H9Y04_30400 [Streptomyces sp. TRM66268-LWL]|uniref:Molecular chaperone DnaJ n=1 Tax=Streptomyces polyasparticus TaxID=2767826 RepID=A0ABR7SNB2_9ACTN|nr:hypothetical protein [Streptomyces polyasparticus]MBC9716854.1 hypothetical protein [Streptomyces polyasparticus]
MPERQIPAGRICKDCDGFASVAITVGGRDRHGHLRTITAHCPACNGTGTTRKGTGSPALLAQVGR